MKSIFLSLVFLCHAAAASLPGVRYLVEFGTDPLTLDRTQETTETEITLTGLTPGATCYARVQAISLDGILSEKSALVTYQVPQNEPSPMVPVNVWQVDLLGNRLLIGTLYVARKEKDFFQLSYEITLNP
jgi:hypothetical protein